MKRLPVPFVILMLVALLAAGPAAAGKDLPTLDQVLSRYVEVMGGAEAIGKLETRTITGRQIDDRPYRGPAVTSSLKAFADAAGDWTMSLDGPEGQWREGCAAGRPWVRQPGEDGSEGTHGNTKLGFLFNAQGPLQVARYFPNPRLTGTWTHDGVAYYQVENDLAAEHYTLYFEVETGMLTRIGYHWRLEDFRPVDGVLVPGKVVRGRKGGSTDLIFDDVAHGAHVAPHLGPGGK